MYVVSPLSRCASAEKRDTFLNYIADIAPVTYANEPDCIGYAWFCGTEDNDAIPPHWCRGFEVYSSPEASRVTHRESQEYKAFRHAVGTEELLESPSDLDFWRSTGIGFLTKYGLSTFSSSTKGRELQYVVTDELAVPKASMQILLEQLNNVAKVAEQEPDVETCWVLDRKLEQVGTEPVESNVYVFLRFREKRAYELYKSTASLEEWTAIEQLAVKRRTTVWKEAGIGFLGK